MKCGESWVVSSSGRQVGLQRRTRSPSIQFRFPGSGGWGLIQTETREPNGLPASETSMSSDKGQTGDVVLPQSYVVKYLGSRDARGLWGIKHTRHPVDELVAAARQLHPGATLPYLRLEVSSKGVRLSPMPQNQNRDFRAGLHPIESISYGVQDLVYTRVFAMIVVREDVTLVGDARDHPFLCHAFVCDSRQNARSLTLTLARAFQDYSRTVKGLPPPRKFAIDLRSQEEIQAEMDIPQESHA